MGRDRYTQERFLHAFPRKGLVLVVVCGCNDPVFYAEVLGSPLLFLVKTFSNHLDCGGIAMACFGPRDYGSLASSRPG